MTLPPIALPEAGRPASLEPDRKRRLSIVVLVYNEQESLQPFYARLGLVRSQLSGYALEVIFVDDGSLDASFALLRSLRERDPAVKVLRLSRNFGSWSAVAAGVQAASGDAVLWITSDLQDPPELIPRLVRAWEEGADVVWAVRALRDDPWPRRIAASIFYRILRRIGVPDYPILGVDICLLDRRVADVFNSLTERNRFTQALIMSLGFTQVTIPYARERRRHGASKWGNLPRLSKIAFDMIVGSSYFPFRAMLYLGLTLVGLSVLLALTLLVVPLRLSPSTALWLPAVLAVAGMGGLQAVMGGILGEYVWRVLEEVRGRPFYIVRERLGFDEHPTASTRRESRDPVRG